MNRKLKIALAALLGFSAACSTVKNAPKGNGSGSEEMQRDSAAVRGRNPRIVVMYGVRRPEPVGAEAVRKSAAVSELDPVVEAPGPDTLRTTPAEPATVSGLDPVIEQPDD